jgi:hypothetical protein
MRIKIAGDIGGPDKNTLPINRIKGKYASTLVA